MVERISDVSEGVIKDTLLTMKVGESVIIDECGIESKPYGLMVTKLGDNEFQISLV